MEMPTGWRVFAVEKGGGRPTTKDTKHTKKGRAATLFAALPGLGTHPWSDWILPPDADGCQHFPYRSLGGLRVPSAGGTSGSGGSSAGGPRVL